MALFDEDTTGGPETPPPFKANKTPFQDVSVDTEFTPFGKILTAVEGKRWPTEAYFSQVLNQDNETSAQQESRLAINQQYNVIYDLELKVLVPLPINPTFNEQSQEFTVSGESHMAPGVRPNFGDMFIATLLDGRKGLFQISEQPQQLSIYLQSMYRITYVMKKFLDQASFDDLMSKVVRKYYYVPSFLDSGINPVITDEAHEQYKYLKELRESTPVYYLTKFFNREYGTLIIPGQGNNIIYDPFITTFISNIWQNLNLGPFHGMNFLNVMDNSLRDVKTLYDGILTTDNRIMDLIETTLPVVDTWAFVYNPYFYGANFMGVPFAVFPNRPDLYSTQYPDYKPKAVSLKPSGQRSIKVRFTLDQLYPSGTLEGSYSSTSPSIKPVTIDDYYVLSEDFYAHRPGNLSTLEALVWQALDNRQVEATELVAMFDEARNWNDLEQFYYFPLLCSLIPYALRGLPA